MRSPDLRKAFKRTTGRADTPIMDASRPAPFAARLADERGIALVSVVLLSSILFSLGAVVIGRSLSDYNQVRGDRRFEQTIQVADSGVDRTLFKVGADPTYSTGETLPDADSFPTTEEAWVLDAAADNPAVKVAEGEWVVVKPSNASVIYSIGYVPSRAAPVKTRLIRAVYDLAPFVPNTAILTAGDLEISGSVEVTGVAGSIHANGDIAMNGGPAVDGYVSAGGDYDTGNSTIGDPANSGGGKPPREVPLVDPRESYALSEYDLCPDGTVRGGPSFSGPERNLTTTPCAGGTAPGWTTGVEYRGWTHQGEDWKYNSGTAYDGVYYVYHGSVQISGSPGSAATPWNVTIMAEAQGSGAGEPGHCPHTGGDIDVSGSPVMRPFPAAAPLLLIAGRDLELTGTGLAGDASLDGVIAVHEQFKLSGTKTINGIVLANDYCHTAGSPVDKSTISGTITINYDGGLEVPLGLTIRTTHWNEI